MNIHSIYKITHLDTGRCYIGYSKDYQKRWAQYRKLKPGRTKRRIDHAIAKYGQDAFTFEVIYQSTDRDHVLNEMESFFIEQYDSIANGFNMRQGGVAQPEDFLHGDEIRKKISDRTKEGMAKFTPEQRSLFAGAGAKWTPEANKNRSEAIKASAKYRESRKITAEKTKEYWSDEENRLKMAAKVSEALTGRSLTSEHRQRISQSNRSSVIWIFRYNGKYHYVNGSSNDYVAKHFPFHPPAIQSALKEYHTDAERKDKSRIVYGCVSKGVAKGFEVTRLPEKFMAGQHEKLSWVEAVERANYLIQNGYAKGDVAELAKVLYENANK